MLRKITALLAMLTLTGSMLASAMFFDDNPRYIQVDRDDTTESYIDFKGQTVKVQTIATCVYNEDGVPSPFTPIANPVVGPCDPMNSKAADNAFFSCYNMTFYHTFNN